VTAPPPSQSLARWISILGHPFTFVLILVLATSGRGDGGVAAYRAAAIVLAVVLVPLGLFFWRRRASGRWTTIDASEPHNRPALYAAALALLVPLALYYRFAASNGGAETTSRLLTGTLAAGLLLGLAAAANRWIKLSLHTAFAVFAGVVLAGTQPALGFAILAFAPILGWARLAMGRHALEEVVGGAVLGAAVGLFTLWA
jgi:membrane-associated phospholipid phosphatase